MLPRSPPFRRSFGRKPIRPPGALAPVHAVRGNVDHGAWSANLPATRWIEIDGLRIYVLHILAELDPQTGDNVDAVIYGHSHQPKIDTKNGTLFFNPGSAEIGRAHV